MSNVRSRVNIEGVDIKVITDEAFPEFVDRFYNAGLAWAKINYKAQFGADRNRKSVLVKELAKLKKESGEYGDIFEFMGNIGLSLNEVVQGTVLDTDFFSLSRGMIDQNLSQQRSIPFKGKKTRFIGSTPVTEWQYRKNLYRRKGLSGPSNSWKTYGVMTGNLSREIIEKLREGYRKRNTEKDDQTTLFAMGGRKKSLGVIGWGDLTADNILNYNNNTLISPDHLFRSKKRNRYAMAYGKKLWERNHVNKLDSQTYPPFEFEDSQQDEIRKAFADNMERLFKGMKV